MKHTLFLAAILVLAYFSFSSLSFFIPSSTILEFGFSGDNWPGLLIYPFLHIGMAHLVSNIALLFAFGFVVETKLSWKEYYAIFFFSGILAAVTFFLLTENIVLAGASAAIGGFLIPACFIDFKRTLSYMVLFSLVSVVLIQPLDYTITQEYFSSKQKSSELMQAYENVINQKAAVEQNISELDDKLKKGEIDTVEYSQTISELTQAAENLSEAQQAVSEQINSTSAAVYHLEEGLERQNTTQSSPVVHVVGSAAGLVYLALFRRDIIWNSGYQVLRLERWLKSCLGKSNKPISKKSSR